MIKLVLSDVDGTLVPFGHSHASERTYSAIRALKASGIRFGLSTGRDSVELTAQFEGQEDLFDTGILSNGKKLMVDGELVRLTLLDNRGLNRMASLMEDYPQTFVTAYPLHTEPGNPIYCVGATIEEVEPWSKRFGFRPIVAQEIPDIEVIGATIACPHEERVMLEIIERGRELCPGFDFVRPSKDWTDILPKGLNKGSALTLLLDELGMSPDEVVVCGDADNDLAIMSRVSNSVAVANAMPSVKASARWHIGAAEDDAMADLLERMAKKGMEGLREAAVQTS